MQVTNPDQETPTFEITVDDEDVFYEETIDYDQDDIGPLTREKLIELTECAIAKEKEREDNKNNINEDVLEKKTKELASNIVEWVYISAYSGEWSFKQDMSKIEEEYLLLVSREVKKIIPSVMIVNQSGEGRYILVSWNKQQ
jgi:hypothetical protein